VHHRTFPAALVPAALALVTGCSGDETGNPSGADGRQVPGTSAGQGLPDSSDETVPDGPTGQDRNQDRADPAGRCVAAILATLDGSVPDECEGLSSEQQEQVTEALKIATEVHGEALDNMIDSAFRSGATSRRRAAVTARHQVRYVSGGLPTRAAKRRAKAARERPAGAASDPALPLRSGDVPYGSVPRGVECFPGRAVRSSDATGPPCC